MKPTVPTSFYLAVQEFSKLPGIGEKTAERLVFHLLKQSHDQIRALGNSIVNLPEQTKECRICHNFCTEDLCHFCENPKRIETSICVVEMPQDLYILEDICDFRGRYHVLGGRYSPLEGIFPEDLNIETLIRRIKHGNVEEVILAMNPNTEGEATSELLLRSLRGLSIKVSKLATGIQHGSDIEYAGRGALRDAFQFRREVGS